MLAPAKPQPAPPDAAPATLARFLDEARALEPAQIVPMRTDPRAVQHHVGLGVAAVLEFRHHIHEHLPHVDLDELRSLPDLALCLLHACSEVDTGEVAVEARVQLAEAHTLRRLLRAAALALAEAGLITPKEAAKLPVDRGAVDAAADCLALAALFERHAEEIAGQTPVHEDQRARAAEVGASLRALQKPKGAARKVAADGLSAVDVRDRLWTLLVTRHERLWAVGAYVFGHAVDEHVPPLAAPMAAPKGKKASKA